MGANQLVFSWMIIIFLLFNLKIGNFIDDENDKILIGAQRIAFGIDENSNKDVSSK